MEIKIFLTDTELENILCLIIQYKTTIIFNEETDKGILSLERQLENALLKY